MKIRNEAKYQAFRAVFARLEAEHPLLNRTQVIGLISEQSGKPEATIRYYVTDREAGDLRRRYSPKEIERFALMSLEQQAREADRRGITAQSLRAAVANNLATKRRSSILISEAKTKAELVGFLDFSDGLALAGFGLTRKAVLKARKALSASWGLDLESPNLLIHVATERVISLRLPEQIQIILYPKNFIKAAAASLGTRWEKRL